MDNQGIERRRFIQMAGIGALAASSLGIQISTVEERSTKQILPPRLKKGGRIALIAPGGAIFNDHNLLQAEEGIRLAGYVPVRMKNLLARHGQFAGTDQQRADDIHQAFADPEIIGIVAVRGGSGCARLWDKLDYDLIARRPKVLMGFSDLTSLLQMVWHITGLVTFHGPVGYSSWNSFSIRAMENVLLHGHQAIELGGKQLSSQKGADTLKGRLHGGNLRVFSHLIGTSYEPSGMEDMIIFLEEVSEEPYSIDRSLMHLLQWKHAHRIAAVVLGQFSKCVPEEPDRSLTLEQVFAEFAQRATFPVWHNANFGHVRDKLTLPIGIFTSLDLRSGTLKLEEPCVLPH